MSHHESENESSPDRPFPGDLLAAIDRAKQRRATTAMVENLKERVLHDEREIVSPVQRAFWKRSLAWGLATAAALLIGITATFLSPPPPIHDDKTGLSIYPIRSFSAVTEVSLVDVVYLQMADDLDRIDTELDEVSEGLQMAALRHEIEMTLDEFYDRSK